MNIIIHPSRDLGSGLGSRDLMSEFFCLRALIGTPIDNRVHSFREHCMWGTKAYQTRQWQKSKQNELEKSGKQKLLVGELLGSTIF